MLAGIKGTLISQFFAEEILFSTFAGQLGEDGRGSAQAAMSRWWQRSGADFGPASARRTLWDCGAAPTLGLLGYDVSDDPTFTKGVLTGRGRAQEIILRVYVSSWDDDLDRVWRAVARHDHAVTRWCICYNGRRLRLVDAMRVYADCFLEFDLEIASADPRVFAVFWAVLRASVFRRSRSAEQPHELSLFDRFAASSAAHAAGVCRSLQRGVLEAVSELLTCLASPERTRSRMQPPSREALSTAFHGSLMAVYRVLFLLFAEARGLVPVWHPIYRDSYSIEALRSTIEQAARPRGLWDALQAISRLAREGCAAGDLRVTPFNGRLFAPLAAIDRVRPIADAAVQRALLALSTTSPGSAGRQRIDYRDLGVEQLGAVYEAVLDYEPSWDGDPHRVVRLERGGRERKATGTFYTPRSITEYLVRRTLHPLVRDATPEAILALRVLDPAMGSAAFLVAACRYLARAYEAALIRADSCAPEDITDADRSRFMRMIAQRCLFGVDSNPMAVQLARLSLWLATLAGDRPLTFLDHHLRVGNSLIGATPSDLARRAPPRSAMGRSRARHPSLPFFDESELGHDVETVLPDRLRISIEPGDTLASVREKEQLLDRISNSGGTLERWRRLADLWCACWFWPDDQPPSPQTFAAMTDQALRGVSALPPPIRQQLGQVVRSTASGARFFHWLLEFPEAFYQSDGRPLAEPGFDAVLGNPPWDMVRADAGRSSNRRATIQQIRFIKDSGAYRCQSRGHVNLYQVFLERAIQLARRGGRVGIVLPSGLLTDQGAAPIRRLLLHRCQTDSLVVLENRQGVFPIHRSMKFVLLTSTTGGETVETHCRMGVRDPTALDTVDEASTTALPVRLTRRFIEQISGADLAIPETHTTFETALLERISGRYSSLSDTAGWNVAFGRELNATDDSEHFSESGDGVPVLEGKQLEPFGVQLHTCRRWLRRSVLSALLGGTGAWRRPRLAYREVASATNRLTLIAAIVPGDVVTTHSVFCLKTTLSIIEQHYLCGMLNSFVANFLVRLFVTTHVTAGIIGRLRVPRFDSDDPLFRQIAALSVRLSTRGQGRDDDYARLQALAAHAYELDEREFAHVLGTFPLVDAREREAALECFRLVRMFLKTRRSCATPGDVCGTV